MKYSCITLFITIIALSCVGYLRLQRNFRPFDNVLEEMINTSCLNTYKDSIFGYEVKYPDCFEAEPDSQCEYAGDARFSYGNIIEIDMESTVSRKMGANNKYSIDSIARRLGAKIEMRDQDSFILTGPQYENGCRIDGCSQYCKYVAKGKLWFAYSLYYPDKYRNRIQRLFHIIADWEPFKEQKSHKNTLI